jgi:hypothetical protein
MHLAERWYVTSSFAMERFKHRAALPTRYAP